MFIDYQVFVINKLLFYEINVKNIKNCIENFIS